MTRTAKIFHQAALMTTLAMTGACQTPPSPPNDSLADIWKPLYKDCLKQSFHRNPALAMHLDAGELSDRCRALAKRMSGSR